MYSGAAIKSLNLICERGTRQIDTPDAWQSFDALVYTARFQIEFNDGVEKMYLFKSWF